MLCNPENRVIDVCVIRVGVQAECGSITRAVGAGVPEHGAGSEVQRIQFPVTRAIKCEHTRRDVAPPSAHSCTSVHVNFKVWPEYT